MISYFKDWSFLLKIETENRKDLDDILIDLDLKHLLPTSEEYFNSYVEEKNQSIFSIYEIKKIK